MNNDTNNEKILDVNNIPDEVKKILADTSNVDMDDDAIQQHPSLESDSVNKDEQI